MSKITILGKEYEIITAEVKEIKTLVPNGIIDRSTLSLFVMDESGNFSILIVDNIPSTTINKLKENK